MKKIVKLAPVALAVSALCAAPAAMADNDFSKTYTETVIVNLLNEGTVVLDKEMIASYDFSVWGGVDVTGDIYIDSSAAALVDDKQVNHHNDVWNEWHMNDAVIDGWAFQDASGNIGTNVAAGDNNIQDNGTALSDLSGEALNSSIDAESFALQESKSNIIESFDSTNDAELSGNAFDSASGNIGINIAAGGSNLQKNNLAIALGDGLLAMSSAYSLQQAGMNYITNENTVNNASIGDDVLNYAVGNISVNVASGTNNLQNNTLTLSVAALPTYE